MILCLTVLECPCGKSFFLNRYERSFTSCTGYYINFVGVHGITRPNNSTSTRKKPIVGKKERKSPFKERNYRLLPSIRFDPLTSQLGVYKSDRLS